MAISITARTGEEVFTLAQAKAYIVLATGFTADDTMVSELLEEAIGILEERGKVILQGATVYNKRYGWSVSGWEDVDFGTQALNTISSITYTDTDGDPQTLAATEYYLDTTRTQPRLVYLDYANLPECKDGTVVTINMTAGYATAAEVPTGWRHILRRMVSEYYEHRTDSPAEKYTICDKIIDLYRMPTI